MYGLPELLHNPDVENITKKISVEMEKKIVFLQKFALFCIIWY